MGFLDRSGNRGREEEPSWKMQKEEGLIGKGDLNYHHFCTHMRSQLSEC